MNSEIDHQIWNSIQKGDFDAYASVFREYYPILCKHAVGIVNSNEIAKDIVADVFTRLWEDSKKIKIHSSIKAYLKKCVRNACINYLKRSHRRFLDLDREEVERLHALLPASLDYLDKNFDEEELERLIEIIVNKLPSQCKKIFLLSNKQSLSYKEIAHQLNISVNTVKVQIFRAVLKIKQETKNYFDK